MEPEGVWGAYVQIRAGWVWREGGKLRGVQDWILYSDVCRAIPDPR